MTRRDLETADLNPEAIDVITDALVATRRDGVAGTLVRAEAPWGFRLVAPDAAVFAAVTGGVWWLHGSADRPVRLEAGDVTLMPRPRSGYGLANTPHCPLQDYPGVDELVRRHTSPPPRAIDIPGEGPTSSMICGSYSVGMAGSPLLHALPPLVHVRADDGAARHTTDETLRQLAAELADCRPGAQTVFDRLVDVLLVRTVRTWLSTRRRVGVPRGDVLGDAPITQALACIHDEPARPWTVDHMAAEVALSRATFVRRFTALVGESPMSYLTRRRLDVAARRLRDTDEPLSVVARGVGYSSEFTFSRAFSRAYRQPPGRYRAANRPN